MKLTTLFLMLVLTAATAFAQSAPTLRIVTEDPNLPSELYYGNIKVKPLRLRPGTNQVMTINDNDFMIQQHYIDFLSRMPDPGGFAAWLNILAQCPQGSIACDRTEVSSAFFRSPEFGDRGRFIYNTYESLGRTPVNRPQYAEFITDMRRLSGALTAEQIEANKVTFLNDFVARAEFKNKFDGLSNAQFVDTIIANIGITLANRNQLVADLNNGRSRVQVLRDITQSSEAQAKVFNRAFVAMEYFGYLRRDPDDVGFNHWVNYLNTTGDYRELVRGFLYSDEYFLRF